MKLNIELRTSPHLRKTHSVDTIMRNVVYALLPIATFAVYQFGISALALLLTVVASCLLTEALFNYLGGRPNTINDYSAVITGILLALTLPPGFPLWMSAVAGFIAIGLGKSLFGGLGYNLFNPALVGRAFVQAAFPVAVTTWPPAYAANRFVEFIPTTLTLPFTEPVDITGWSQQVAVDAFSGATPLALQKFEGVTTPVMELFTGMSAGSSGETSALLILLCGTYLVARRMMDWRIPVGILASAGLTAWLLHLSSPETHPGPLFMLFSGGLMLGAVFMASDMVASPVTPLGIWLYATLIGVVTIIIRLYGGLTEGVMYAILLGNAMAPLIENMTQPRAYGHARRRSRS
ncbi:MAG: RnfABCDGE type electron transport complex subunit D [Gammaproteobacteria bacterium]|nr:RnfABCDGE type electron transport complex subunit D [Gammaproteobacteria bacterium]MCW8928349.1 RnfABCDGE type electron transport complex subunit D [Gammaproteobacteria bacterium]MCW8959335.1 RnfABCDGE type electron transport complex subunit D [Gammaproteobacteria bacterium]MCW8973332.1 RnfABCDGE type electron transport complex subunit D [Gammaproteobacteria bacterium]MCW8992585.1 RnfABCDGE type electron transport complex subunit D [Gammaproteobacteria bacterium]